jgi:type IV pilus assembly protein PilY1
MASRQVNRYALSTAVVVAAGSWFLFSVMAVQGQGALAQAPLNVQVQIPPAFIMGVDNSGSMSDDQLLFRTSQGHGFWNTTTRSYFDAAGVANEAGTQHRSAVDGGSNPVPRPDMFGAARSPLYNRAYFNPKTTYGPWLTASGVPESNANPAATRRDPRSATPVVNFTAKEAYTYTFPTGSTLAKGTEYYANSDCNRNGIPGTEWRILAADLVFESDCPTEVRYYRAVVYLPDSEPMPAGYDPDKRIRVAGAGPGGIDLWRYDYIESNFLAGGGEAVQNFANWWSYYGTRQRAMIAAMTYAMADINNVRVGYFQINPPYPGTNVYMHDMSVGGDKILLYQKMRALNASGSTPSRRATRYMGEQFMRDDTGAPVKLACQKNGGMLFTDGFTNDDALSGDKRVGNADGGMGSPFADTHSNTIADLAAWMYNTNIRPDLPAGKVPVPSGCSSANPDPRLDCQKNLHVNFYGVTLGARGAVYDVNMASTNDPYGNPPAWAATASMNLQAANVDDIWHASLNSRGEYINAQTPSDVTEAIRRVLASVSAGSSPAGTIALTGSRIGNGSLTVVPFYEARNEGTDWYSTLTAQRVSVAPSTGTVNFSTSWEASTKFPDPGLRNILVGRGNSLPATFDSANVTLDALCNNPRPGMSVCTAAQLSALGGGTTIDEAVSYIRGDQSLEVDRSVGGKLRFRTTVLGDIVNSTPVVSAPTDDYGYRGLPSPYGDSYTGYLATTKVGRRPMVYAGANAGMLHGFDGRTTADVGGVEAFGFMPQSVLGHTGNLLFPYVAADDNDQKFKHRYYVDGPLTVSDAYYGGGWKTVLVGTTGAGARGVFALNVSGVSAIGGDLSPSDRLWEISDVNMALDEGVRNNVGHVLGKPVIVPVKTGGATGTVKWRAIFGNGYNSVDGKAVLFMVDIASGVAPQVTMVEASEASGPAGPNGLGNIVVADRWGPASDNTLTVRRSDGFADTVYGADQKGAIWKFDLRSASPVNQTIPVFTTQLYTAGPETGTRQPILGGITAAAGPAGGVMLYFGTGSFSFDNDPLDQTTQSVYGVSDSSLGSPLTTITPASLLQQSILATAGTARSTTSSAMTPDKKGWYLNLPLGERFVGYPKVEGGTVFMPTYSPNAASECATTGVNWLYGLNALSGSAGLSTVRYDSPTGTSPGSGTGAVALDTTGTAPVKDVAVLTGPRIAPLAAGSSAADLASALAAQCSMIIQVAGAPPLYMPRACGRQSWRQIR